MTALPGTGRAARQDCCSLACDYDVPKVRAYVGMIRSLRANGEDPAEALLTVLGSKSPDGRGQFGAGSSQSRFAVIVADIERAMREAGPGATPEQVAHALCPWSGDAE